MSTLIRLDGVIVGGVGHSRAYHAPAIEALPDGHPLLRFVTFMCAYALEVAQRRMPGPYSDEDAARFAREALIDEIEFRAARAQDDVVLAARFGVPVEQIARRRLDLQ